MLYTHQIIKILPLELTKKHNKTDVFGYRFHINPKLNKNELKRIIRLVFYNNTLLSCNTLNKVKVKKSSVRNSRKRVETRVIILKQKIKYCEVFFAEKLDFNQYYIDVTKTLL